MPHMITSQILLLLILFAAASCLFLVPAKCDQGSALELQVLRAHVIDPCRYTYSNITLTTTAKLVRNPNAYFTVANAEEFVGKLRSVAYRKMSLFPKEDLRSFFWQEEHARCIYNKMHTLMQKTNILSDPEAAFTCLAYIRASLGSHERIVGSIVGDDSFYIPSDEHDYLDLHQKMVKMSGIATSFTYHHVRLLSLAVSSLAPPQDAYLHHATRDRVWQDFPPYTQNYKPQATTLNFSFALPDKTGSLISLAVRDVIV